MVSSPVTWESLLRQSYDTLRTRLQLRLLIAIVLLLHVRARRRNLHKWKISARRRIERSLESCICMTRVKKQSCYSFLEAAVLEARDFLFSFEPQCIVLARSPDRNVYAYKNHFEINYSREEYIIKEFLINIDKWTDYSYIFLNIKTLTSDYEIYIYIYNNYIINCKC